VAEIPVKVLRIVEALSRVERKALAASEAEGRSRRAGMVMFERV
jgi:hypothetical protein